MNIGYLGLVFSLSLNLALGSLLLYHITFYYYRKNQDHRNLLGLEKVCKTVSLTSFFFVTISFFSLIQGFLKANYSIVLVFKYVSNDQPWFYRLGALWGNHDGSMLLWVWILHLVQVIFINSVKKKSSIQNFLSFIIILFITCTFTSYTITVADPFTVFQLPKPLQGRGLIPLLQDPLLVIHPPILYLGYALSLIPFSQSLGFLLSYKYLKTLKVQKKELDIFLKALKLPVYSSWFFITLGIILGSYWAYYELGWGGYWFWDPVENISLLPWLMLLSIIHFRFLCYKEEKYYGSLIFSTVSCFILCLIGFFLVRSGILSSVHTFAHSQQKGLFLLGILIFWGTISLSIFAYRIPLLWQSRERSWLVPIGVYCFYGALIIILWGSIYPLIMQSIFYKYLSIGSLYFEILLLPIIFLCIITAVFAHLEVKNNKRKWLEAGFYIIIVLILFLYMHYQKASLMQCTVVGLGACLIISMIFFILRKSIGLRRLGIALIHGGFGLFLFAAGWDGAFQKSKTLIFEIGERKKFQDYEVLFRKYKSIQKDNYQAVEAPIEVSKYNRYIGCLRPQWRFYKNLNQDSQKTSQIIDMFFHQIYASIQGMERNRVGIRIWYRPCINLLWGSGFVMLLGLLIFALRRTKSE